MPSFVPLRRTYSALSSSLSSSDDTRSTNIHEIVVQPSDSSPRTIHRYSFLIRSIVFVILEFGFIALVSAALFRPMILHVSFTNSEVKGAVTVIAIAWHALAVYVVKDILLNVFSAEWMGQYDGSKRFTLQDLDVVSRLTTGFIDHARHCTSTRATLPFCLSFLSLLLLMLLNGLGPSAIGIDLVYHKTQATTQVANLTLWKNGSRYDAFLLHVESRANALVQLEVIQNLATVRFSSTQPNILIPWPSSDSVSENISMTYESDVIWSNMSCSWKVSSVAKDGIWISVDANHQPELYEIITPSSFQDIPANYLFNSALVDAIGNVGFLSVVSAQLFFTTDSFATDGPLKPFPLDQINQNMTTAFASAAKAYLSGYVPGNPLDRTVSPYFAMVNTSAAIEEQRLALVGRKPFFIASSAIVGLLVILLGAIVAVTRPDQLEDFELENIVRKLK